MFETVLRLLGEQYQQAKQGHYGSIRGCRRVSASEPRRTQGLLHSESDLSKILIRLYSLTCQNVAIDLSLAALTLVVQLTRSLLDDRLDQTSLILFTTHQLSILSEGPTLKL
jgi:hypothetical protein